MGRDHYDLISPTSQIQRRTKAGQREGLKTNNSGKNFLWGFPLLHIHRWLGRVIIFTMKSG
jgi:hypothetical protein